MKTIGRNSRIRALTGRVITCAAALGLVVAVQHSSVRAQIAVSEAYEPLGIRAGSFIAYPELRLEGQYTDNVARTRRSRDDDVGLAVAPRLLLRSEWPRHELRLDLSSRHVFYSDRSDQDETTADLRGGLRLDFRGGLTGDTEAYFAQTEESTAAADVPDAAVSPRQDQRFGTSFALTYQPARLATTLRGGLDVYRFGDVQLADGTIEDNSDRDFMAPFAALRLGYSVSPAVRTYAEARYQPFLYRREVDRNGLRRSSDGYILAVGLDFNPDPLWSVSGEVRYEIRDRDDPNLKTVRGFGFAGTVAWRPTRLTTIRLAAASGLEETVVAGASSVRRNSIGLGAEHVLRDTVGLEVRASYSRDDYRGADITDETYRLALGLSYLLSRDVALLAGYRYTVFDTTAPERDYTENRFTLGVRLTR